MTVLISSTANDQLTQFDLALDSVTLVSSEGKSVSLFSLPQNAEFIHVNGKLEPLITVSIPRGTYTSAQLEVGSGDFACEALDSSGSVFSSQTGVQQVPESGVTVNLTNPITVGGAATAIVLDLQVSQSASWGGCSTSSGTQPFSITPTVVISQMGNSDEFAGGVTMTGLLGLVSSVDASRTHFEVTSANIPLWESDPSGPSWQIYSNNATSYQGITGLSQLVAGMPVDVDAVLQADGSLLATRIAVYDTNIENITISNGPLLSLSASEPVLKAFNMYAEGLLSGGLGGAPFSYGNANFQISDTGNLQSLPFNASFTATNMVAGQNVLISTHALSLEPNPVYMPAATVTLLPQTINGTVSAISSQSGFTTYTVTLAPYDLFPQFAVQPDQTTVLTNPNTVVVYADSKTQMLNTQSIAVGNVVRFYGLIFNDSGTLRMDCAQVNDGVPE